MSRTSVKSRRASRLPTLIDRFGQPCFDQRDLPRHVGRRERGALPRAGVVERTGHNDVDAVLACGAEGELLLRELAHRVRIRRADRTSSVSGDVDGA